MINTDTLITDINDTTMPKQTEGAYLSGIFRSELKELPAFIVDYADIERRKLCYEFNRRNND